MVKSFVLDFLIVIFLIMLRQMVDIWLERTELLIKEAGIEKLKKSSILIVGMGGVGSFAAEFIARSGVGNLTIVDGDIIDITNINRQLPALHSTVGDDKVELMARRILDINPELNLTRINEFLNPERMDNHSDRKLQLHFRLY
ncbi:hypothetical protein FQR65_LT19157 [Abscondita terminalis]|nr:hypothetical protein FQR65_LT19157 [Abscondita terminalis]